VLPNGIVARPGSNPGPRVRIPSALTTKPLSHSASWTAAYAYTWAQRVTTSLPVTPFGCVGYSDSDHIVMMNIFGTREATPVLNFHPRGFGGGTTHPRGPGAPPVVNDYQKQMPFANMLSSSTHILAIYAESYEK